MDQFQQYIHISRYARWREELMRRETWEETVDRYCTFFDKKFGGAYSTYIWQTIKPAILNLEVMPSMRAMMTAGPALERENLAGYNCSYLAVNNKRSFSETLYILLCGTGVGFSCERQEINKLPEVPEKFTHTDDVIVVEDSKEGWAKAYRKLISALYEGDIPKVDYSKVRPAGARLKTFGGRASGPEPLKKLFGFTIDIFRKAEGRKLTSLEVHDLMCMIGDVVVVGGVRRSALISLSNLSDLRMRDAKSGRWWETTGWRALANNSAVYTEKPSATVFMEEWLSLIKSQSGERGIFNRQAAQTQAAKWGRRDPSLSYGCNPCSEIILRDKQLCNLSEVVVRSEDTIDDLRRKVEIATVIGTFQSTLTDFKFVSEAWKKNTEEERLLGVSMTGIFDNSLTSGQNGITNLRTTLRDLRDHARAINKEWAEKLDIPESTAITCVKPSGTVGSLVDSASGIHPRWGKYYIRTARMDKKDPVYKLMKEKGFYLEDAIGKEDSTAIAYFPTKAPEFGVTRDKISAIEHLKLWLIYQQDWCEHKPSVTINVKESEWPEVGGWVYNNFDEISGVSFLPYDEHTYQQAPYTEVSKDEYDMWVAEHPMPEVDWAIELSRFEKEDNTVSMQTLACSGNSCDFIGSVSVSTAPQ